MYYVPQRDATPLDQGKRSKYLQNAYQVNFADIFSDPPLQLQSQPPYQTRPNILPPLNPRSEPRTMLQRMRIPSRF